VVGFSGTRDFKRVSQEEELVLAELADKYH